MLNNCPTNTYTDSFMAICQKTSSLCQSGTVFNQQCTLKCPANYRLAKILPDPGQPFAKDYSKVDFSSVQTSVTCVVSGQSMQWNYASEITNYYCRRANDPPTELFISRLKILEHSPKGTVVGNLSSRDPQVGQTFTYTVQPVAGNLVFFRTQKNQLVNEWIPKLNGPVPLNSGTVDITVRVSDSGTPQMWKDTSFTISVENVNDPPHSVALSRNSVNESASIGKVVGVLTAIDGDDALGTPPHSDKFQWTLVDSDNNNFRLDGTKVVVNKNLNHEANNYHRIQVKCTDFGSPPKSVQKTFIINVLDTNDKPLSITLTKSSINENSAIGTSVGSFVASDEDGDPLDFQISFSESATLEMFELGQKTCSGNGQTHTCNQELMVRGALDYESRNAYTITVMVNDSISHLTKTFNVTVVNVNEQPTDLIFNRPREINENTAVGNVIGSFVVSNIIYLLV